MYKTRLWRNLRRIHLDRYPLCARCRVEGRLVAATVVHHLKPHRGDMVLFNDPRNLASSCKPCHDRVEQGIESRGYDKAVGLDGWPIDDGHPFNTVD
jgi:5-methylcytosine-specific restriction endonuclease McrA